MVAVLVTNTVSPVTMPVVEPTIAIVVLLLLHVPPPTSLNDVVEPEHTVSVPSIAVGKGSTVNTAVIRQPVDKVYVTVSNPGVTPFAMPVPPPIVALPLLSVHVPPVAASLKFVVDPTHTDKIPFIAPGNALTVTIAVV